MLAPELLAVLAALCFGGSQVTVRRGVVSTSVVSAVLVSLTTALVVLGSLVLLDPPRSLEPRGVLLFALAGLVAPGISRWAATTGVHQLGPSVAVPITQGARPLLAVGGAMVFLSEPLGPARAIGLIVIVAGGWVLSRSRGDARALGMGSLEGPIEDDGAPAKAFFRPGIVFPLIAGGSYATSDVVVKTALGEVPEPVFGAAVGMACALILWTLAAVVVPPVRRQVRFGKDVGWLVASGVFAGLALVNLFGALELADVTLVSPIIASQPLAVFILSRVFLRDLERLHLSTVLAGCAVVVGTVVVSL